MKELLQPKFKQLEVDSLFQEFFNDFKSVFIELRDNLILKTGNITGAHNFALRLLNRIVFKNFLDSSPIINNNANLQSLATAQMLKCRLFEKNEPNDEYNLLIDNKILEKTYTFLERYRFESGEQGSLDQQAAINPEMIGKVYERLVNTTETNERANAGIFYTQPVEIDLMCRLALVDNLSNHLGLEFKNLLYDILFALTITEKSSTDQAFSKVNMWPALNNILQHIKVIDPACGSGSFLITMLHILDDLQRRANSELGLFEESYQRKRRIVNNNLFGVDIKDWAYCITELRLLLSAVIDNELACTEKKMVDEFFMSDFIFNINCMDVLNQEKKLVENFSINEKIFDIVISNPPYVRQEHIADPYILDTPITLKDKKVYKSKIANCIYKEYPCFFGYNDAEATVKHKLNAKSDLYIYFYFQGLSVLNPKGTLCFLSSNSWLDVDFGSDLQEFLLKYCHIKMLLDNKIKRSFYSADINTVIVIASAPNDNTNYQPDRMTNFLMLNIPFEQVFSSHIFKNIETEKEPTTKPEYSIYPIKQVQLLEDTSSKHSDHAYKGNKWGAKYLRSPGIYRVIQKKYKDKLLQLGTIADVSFGIKSGVNDFFYLDKAKIDHWQIETEFLKPLLFSLKEIRKYKVSIKTLKRKIFVCNKTKELLSESDQTGALNYILQGEKEDYNLRPSVAKRPLWYSLPKQEPPHFVSNRFIGKRLGFPSIDNILVSDVFFVGRFHKTNSLLGTALLNSAISFLSAEVLSRKTYGIGVAYLYGPELNMLDIVNPQLLKPEQQEEIVNIFTGMQQRNLLSIEDEFKQADRITLDSIVFDLLELSQTEQDAVYESVLDMISSRLQKAASLGNNSDP